MAIHRADCQFTLIEPMERRAQWLQMVVEELRLTNVQVRRARAEEVHDEVFDVVTARAVAALPKLLRLAVPLARHGGRILALKGQRAQEEILEATNLAKKLKIADFKVSTAGEGILPEPTLVVETQLF
jgi:16S rRNA (guanine527-N7)-methyltransferase